MKSTGFKTGRRPLLRPNTIWGSKCRPQQVNHPAVEGRNPPKGITAAPVRRESVRFDRRQVGDSRRLT